MGITNYPRPSDVVLIEFVKEDHIGRVVRRRRADTRTPTMVNTISVYPVNSLKAYASPLVVNFSFDVVFQRVQF
jgi:hypothetical protein